MYLFIMLVIEVILLFVVGSFIGAGNTCLLILGTFIAGIYFFIHSIASIKKAMVNKVLQKDLSKHIGYVIGAIFLILPGFFTDTLGILLVLPFTRATTIKVISEISLIFSSGFFVDIILARLRNQQNTAKDPETYSPEEEVIIDKAQEKEEWKNSDKKIIDAEYKDIE